MITLADFKRVLDKHQQHAPVQMIPIAEDLGIKVYRVLGWPDTVSGRIFRSEERGGDSGFAIEVNASHHENRRRFTIAHEIAHYVLHYNDIGDGLYDDALYRSGLSNYKEVQANQWASRILMPDHLVRQAIMQFGENVVELARVFGVSTTAMSIKLGLPQ